jgi:hypothetical protein
MQHSEIKIEGVKELNPNGYGGMCSRSVLIERKQVDFEKGIETIATTDAPAIVVDWERFAIVREVLPMKYASLPDNDKVPLLDSHSRFSVEMIKGSATGWRTSGSQLMAKTFVSKTETSVREKIEEGHIDSVSIGYRTDRERTVEIPKGAKVVIDGAEYRNDFEDGMPMLVRTWWKVKELSLVPIGADDAAKFKSIAGESEKKFIDKITAQQKQIDEILSQLATIKSPTKKDRKRLGQRLTIMNQELNLINNG